MDRDTQGCTCVCMPYGQPLYFNLSAALTQPSSQPSWLLKVELISITIDACDDSMIDSEPMSDLPTLVLVALRGHHNVHQISWRVL